MTADEAKTLVPGDRVEFVDDDAAKTVYKGAVTQTLLSMGLGGDEKVGFTILFDDKEVMNIRAYSDKRIAFLRRASNDTG